MPPQRMWPAGNHEAQAGRAAARTSMLRSRRVYKLEAEDTEKLAKVGLLVSNAVSIFLAHVTKEDGLLAGLITGPESHDKCSAPR